MPGIDFQTLRAQVRMDAVLNLLGFVPSRRHDGQVRGPCPIHGPHRPGYPLAGGRSFSANLAKNAYRCFHCGSAGNQLDLWAAATRQPLYQAAIELCEKLHRPIPRLPRFPASRKNFAMPS
jgi:DNA primase